MMKLGFSNEWVNLIMNCITTIFYLVIINRAPKGLIHSEKRLGQGSHISSYLFILCVKAFSNLLIQAERNQQIKSLRFAKDVIVSHLLVAYDNLIFTRALVADCKHLKSIFDSYAGASIQIFNFEKSSMFFSGRTSERQITTIKNTFKLNVVSKHERYLGLPSMIGR